MHDNDETLGDREAHGFIPLTFAAHLEESHGPDWRALTHRQALAFTLEGIERDRKLSASSLASTAAPISAR
jgi:hypothetical protein